MVDNCANEFSSFDTFKGPKEGNHRSLDSDVAEQPNSIEIDNKMFNQTPMNLAQKTKTESSKKISVFDAPIEKMAKNEFHVI